MKSVCFFAAALLASASAFRPKRRTARALYDKSCASCHQQPARGLTARPNRDTLRQFSPEMIVTSLTTGRMTQQGYALSETERRESRRRAPDPAAPSGRRTPIAESARLHDTRSRDVRSNEGLETGTAGGGTVANTRYVSPRTRAGITAPLVPRLKLKWAFGFSRCHRGFAAQPVVVAGRLFVSSEERRTSSR